MTLLNHLFGNRKSAAINLEIDAEKRINLWQEHLDNHFKREHLCKFFDYAKINEAIND